MQVCSICQLTNGGVRDFNDVLRVDWRIEGWPACSSDATRKNLSTCHCNVRSGRVPWTAEAATNWVQIEQDLGGGGGGGVHACARLKLGVGFEQWQSANAADPQALHDERVSQL